MSAPARRLQFVEPRLFSGLGLLAVYCLCKMPQTQHEDLEALRQEIAQLTEDLNRERRDLEGMQDERNEALGRADMAEALVRDLRWAAEAFEQRAKTAEARIRKLEDESMNRQEEIKALVRALNDADRRARLVGTEGM